MSTVAKEATSEPMPTPGHAASEAAIVPISELPFMRVRLDLLQPQRDAVGRQRAQDRTALLVAKWKILNETLPMIRSSTLSTLEAVEGKAGVVSLRICYREKYDAIQKSIKETTEGITELEQAARELDEMHAGFLSEMRNTRSSLLGVENQQRAMLNTWASSAIQRGANSRKSIEDILSGDQLYQGRKAKVEFQISNAKKALDTLSPEIEKIETILASVGC